MPRKASKGWQMITRVWPQRSKAVLYRGRSLPSEAIAALYYEEDHDAAARSMSAPLTPLLPALVPKGYTTVYVGTDRLRFLIPAEVVNHERFRVLLDEAEREYGFHSDGPLTLPCDVEMFRNVLHHILSPPCSPVAKKWCPHGRLLRQICLHIGVAAS